MSNTTNKLSGYQINTLKKIGFRDSEISYFTTIEAQKTISKFYQMTRKNRGQVKDMLRKA
jgi:hypothetical protein